MLSCVAPGCQRTADFLLMGMGLCLDHRDSWCQIQLSYYRTVPKEHILAYQEFMAESAQEYLRDHPATSRV